MNCTTRCQQLTAAHQAGIIPIFIARFKQKIVDISLHDSRIPESSSHYVTACGWTHAPWNSVVSQIQLRFGAIFEISTGH